MSKPSCFIIMPLTTPAQYVDQYKGDVDHFIHVLDHLFKPAVEAAGLDPIPPISKGSEVIHGEIIRNLETADLVLCDMSILNPNVFFELGIRTALNKSVAMIRDNATKRVPFDTTIINYHEYDCGLDPWVIPNEIERLTDHLNECMENGSGNSLWGYFSMTQQAEISNDANDKEKQMAYLIRQIDGIGKRLQNIPLNHNELISSEQPIGSIFPEIMLLANDYFPGIEGINCSIEGRTIVFKSKDKISRSLEKELTLRANTRGYIATFIDRYRNRYTVKGNEDQPS